MDFLRQQLFNIIAFVFLGLLGLAAGLTGDFDVTARLSGRIIAAIIVYLAVGLAVLLLWLAKGTASTDLIGAFALSLLGWLIGAAGVVFQTEKRST